jgi:N utilization substance protein A
MVVNELRGEKIDIVPFSEDLADFVAKALSPAKVNQVNISPDGTQADVIVPDHQLSLAIGREGQNARLSARLTGVRVDIRSETQVAEGVPASGYLEEHVEYAEGEWVVNPESGENEWHAADGSVLSQSEWVELTEGVSADDSDRADGDEATDEATADASDEAPAEASDEAPADASDEAPADASDEAPAVADEAPAVADEPADAAAVATEGEDASAQ